MRSPAVLPLVIAAACSGAPAAPAVTTHPTTPGPSSTSQAAGDASANNTSPPPPTDVFAEVTVVAPVRSVKSIRLDQRADLVITGGDVHVTDPEGVWAKCEGTPCTIPLAVPGPYELTAKNRISVTARALAPPRAARLAQRTKLVLRPAPVTKDDPRGKIADAVFRVAARGRVAFELAPVGAPADTKLEALRKLVHATVFTPQGIARGVTYADKGRLVIEVEADVGDYVVRAYEQPLEVLVRDPLAPRTDPFPYHPKPPNNAAHLAIGASLAFELAPQTEPVRATVEVPAAHDVALEWEPVNVALATKTATADDYCEQSPCVLAHTPAGTLSIAAQPRDSETTVTVRARALALPPSSGTLTPGASLDVWTKDAPGDPRGGVAEVELDVASAGSFDFAVTAMGWQSAPNLAKLDHLPAINIYDRDNHLVHENAFIALQDDYQAGTNRASFIKLVAGRYRIRLDGTGRVPARQLRVEVRGQ